MQTTSHPRIIYMQVGFEKPKIFMYRTPQTAHQPCSYSFCLFFYKLIKKKLRIMQQLYCERYQFHETISRAVSLHVS